MGKTKTRAARRVGSQLEDSLQAQEDLEQKLNVLTNQLEKEIKDKEAMQQQAARQTDVLLAKLDQLERGLNQLNRPTEDTPAQPTRPIPSPRNLQPRPIPSPRTFNPQSHLESTAKPERPAVIPRRLHLSTLSTTSIPADNLRAEAPLLMRASAGSQRFTQKPNYSPPTFDGKSDFKEFKSLFEDCCQVNGWQDINTMGTWLRVSLRGSARGVILSQDDNYGTLMDRLTARFGSELRRKEYEQRLPTRRRKPGETLHSLVDDIRKMSQVVYWELSPPTIERMAIKHFQMALNDQAAQYELSKAEVNTLEGAVQFALTRENYMGNTPSIHAAMGVTPHQQPTHNKTLDSSQLATILSELTELKELTKEKAGQTRQYKAASSTQENRNTFRPDQTKQYRPTPSTQGNRTGPRKCRECGGDHPIFMCIPCMHCEGQHYHNQCPNKPGDSTQPKNVSVPREASSSSKQGQ